MRGRSCTVTRTSLMLLAAVRLAQLHLHLPEDVQPRQPALALRQLLRLQRLPTSRSSVARTSLARPCASAPGRRMRPTRTCGPAPHAGRPSRSAVRPRPASAVRLHAGEQVALPRQRPAPASAAPAPPPRRSARRPRLQRTSSWCTVPARQPLDDAPRDARLRALLHLELRHRRAPAPRPLAGRRKRTWACGSPARGRPPSSPPRPRR